MTFTVLFISTCSERTITTSTPRYHDMKQIVFTAIERTAEQVCGIQLFLYLHSFARNFHIGLTPTMNVIKNTRPVYNETRDDQIV